MLYLLKKIWADEKGATAIEYALIGGLISVSVILGANQIGGTLGDIFQGHADAVKEVSKDVAAE